MLAPVPITWCLHRKSFREKWPRGRLSKKPGVEEIRGPLRTRREAMQESHCQQTPLGTPCNTFYRSVTVALPVRGISPGAFCCGVGF